MLNDLRGVNIEESDDFHDAYVLTDATDVYPFATVYKSDIGYSVFDVVNDRFRGISIEDEKEYAIKVTARQAVNAIKKMHQSKYGWDNYRTAPEVFEGVLLRFNGGSIDAHR